MWVRGLRVIDPAHTIDLSDLGNTMPSQLQITQASGDGLGRDPQAPHECGGGTGIGDVVRSERLHVGHLRQLQC